MAGSTWVMAGSTWWMAGSTLRGGSIYIVYSYNCVGFELPSAFLGPERSANDSDPRRPPHAPCGLETELAEGPSIFGQGSAAQNGCADDNTCRGRSGWHRHSARHQTARLESLENQFLRVESDLNLESDHSLGPARSQQFDFNEFPRFDFGFTYPLVAWRGIKIKQGSASLGRWCPQHHGKTGEYDQLLHGFLLYRREIVGEFGYVLRLGSIRGVGPSKNPHSITLSMESHSDNRHPVAVTTVTV